MRRRMLGLAGLVLIAGCGGGGKLSESDYRAKYDALCDQQFAFNQGLPARQQRDHLSVDQIQKIANDESKKYDVKYKALKVPDSLKDEFDAVTKVIKTTPTGSTDPNALIAYEQRILAAYQKLGTTHCAANIQKSIDQIKSSIPSASPTP